MLKRKPYTGSTRQLVLAFDVGTTCSGVSYCIPPARGNSSAARGDEVTLYPGQGQVGDFKLPSVMYYDSKGNLKAVGYEALKDELAEEAMSEGWVKLEWWKLHLRPKHLSSKHIKDDDIPPLPKGKSACAETYIQESYPGYIWQSVKDDIQFIFTHPNGWEGAQQQQIRRAIELAGLVPSTFRWTCSRLHFCIWDLFASGEPDQEKYPDGQGVVVIDAGGGTLDLSMYTMKLDPTSFEEIAPAECRLQGSVFVSRRAKGLLQKKLQGSRYSSPEMIDDITNTFDQTTKLHICNAEQPAYIKVGSLRENDGRHDIKAGKLRLSGYDLFTQLFEDSISAVTDAFEQQRKYVTTPITLAFLIGGFGASDWFWSQLESYFKSQGIELSRPSRVYVRVSFGHSKRASLTGYSHKAVPDGALLFLVDHLVKSRVARATYGTTCSTFVDWGNPEHLSRRETWNINAAGMLMVPKAFKPILRRGVQANEQKEFRCAFSFNRTAQSDFGIEVLSILCYRGDSSDPLWIDRDEESFSTLCLVRFDLQDAANTLTPKRKLLGQEGFYYSLNFDVIISFGSTEFSAQVAWKVDVSCQEPSSLSLF
ncbi:hypothetical protein J3R83DRAFT_8024 [Lanmaoa asiatica]|nr:hypothetical protein J3R83DRAFT_8024 [Lanmaoa asiatica]